VEKLLSADATPTGIVEKILYLEKLQHYKKKRLL